MAGNPLQNIFGAIGNAVQGAGNFIGNEVQQFTPAVQNFTNQATRLLSQSQQQGPQIGPSIPQEAQMVQGAVKPFVQIGQGVAQQGLGYFNPNNNTGTPGNPVNNFWNTNIARVLAGQQRAPTFNFAEQDAQRAQNALGNGSVGQIAGFGTQLIEGIPEAVMNVPSQVVQSSIDTAHDVNTGQMNAQHALGDAAELANPLLTVATLGEGGSIVKSLAQDSWKMGALKGLLNGAPIGGAFGLTQGLQDNKNASSVGQQFEKSIPQVLGGMLAGGALGAVLGPAGKLLFGGKTGEAAALSEKGLIPPQAVDDAYKILNVSSDADLGTIRNAYTQALQEFHPQHGGTDESLQVLNNAYEMTTRNHAPTVSFDKNGTPLIQFSDKFGGNLTPEQQVAARKAAADNDAFQQRIAQLKGEQWPEPQGNNPQQTPIDQEDSTLGLNMLKQGEQPAQGADLTDQELGQLQLQQKNPQLQYPEMQTQNLQNLVRVRDGLQAQIKTDVADTPEVKNLVQLRDNTQQQINQAQAILKNYDLYQKRYNNMAPKTAIRSQISELKQQTKNIDLQVNDSRGKLKATNEDQSNRIQLQIKDLENQIKDEQARVRVAQTLAQSPLETPTSEQTAEPSATLQANNGQPVIKAQTLTNDQGVPLKKQQTSTPMSQVDFQNAIDAFGNDESNWGTNRSFANKVEGRVGIGEELGRKLKNYVDANYTPEEQARIMLAGDKSIDPTTLTPKEQELLQQLKPYFAKAAEVRATRDPEFDPIGKDNYMPIQLEQTNKTPANIKKALSKVSPENWQREIQAFDPVNGGKTLVGTAPESVGLKQAGSTFEDANGQQYIPRSARIADYQSIGLEPSLKLGNVLEKYTKSTIKFKENADAIAALKSGNYVNQVSFTPKQGWKTSSVPGLEGVYLEPKLAQAVESLGGKQQATGILGAYDKGTNFLRQTIFYNGLIHPMNEYFNALVGAGKQGPGGILELHKQIAGAAADVLAKNNGISGKVGEMLGGNTADYVAGKQSGIGLGGFKQSASGITENLMNKLSNDNRFAATLGKGVDALNPLRISRGMTSFADDTLRLALQRSYEEKGMSSSEAQANVNHFLVDYGNTSQFEKNVMNRALIFYPWLKGNLGIMGNAVQHPISNLGSIATMAVLYSALSEGQHYIQQQTGNQDVKLRFPGVLGEIRNVAEAPGQLWNNGMAMKGQPGIPNIASNHIQPIIKTGIQEYTNTKNLPDIFKANKTLITKDSDTANQATSARLNVAGGNLLGPFNPINAATEGKKTLGEILNNNIGYGIGVTTPHLQGFQATPADPSASLLGLPLNSPNAKNNTGMSIVENKNNITQQFSPDDIKSLNSLTGKSWKDKAQIFQSNPKLWDAEAQIQKSNAAANGQQYDPIYKQNSQGAKEYFDYLNSSGSTKNQYAYEHPNVIQVDRERNAYYQDPQYQAYEKSQGRSTPLPNPLFDNFNNSQIADYHKWSSLTQGSAEKAAWEASHPWVKDASVGQENYQLQQLQQDWNNRPQNQSQADFLKQHPDVNFAGVDDSGQIIPLREPANNPWLQLNQDQKQIALLYTAERTANGATDAKTKTLIAQNPWLPSYWQANKIYYGSSGNNSDTTGLGLTFGSGGNSGSNYNSSYSSRSNSLQNEMKYLLLNAAPQMTAPKNTNLLNPFNVSGNNTAQTKNGDPLKAYYAQLAKLTTKPLQMPQISMKDLPKLNLPKISDNKIPFKEGVPAQDQGRVEAGRLQTKLN